MYWKRLISFGVFALIFLTTFTAVAQENRCDFKVNVFEPEEIIRLIEAKVSIKSLESNTILDTDTRFEPFIFRNMPEGDYEITVIKDNFKQSVQKVKLNCKQADSERGNSFGVILEKGNPTEKMVVDKRNEKLNSTLVLKAIPARSPEESLKKFAEVNNLLNHKAVSLGKATYPPAAKAVRAAGVVFVEVTIDEKGNVISAQAVSGHPLLRAVTEKAAQESKFPPLPVGQSGKTTGIIVYNFVL